MNRLLSIALFTTLVSARAAAAPPPNIVVTATYVPGLKKYPMGVTDGWPKVAKMTSCILEADVITGPWRMVAHMKDCGEQAYFLNFPSKFISTAGQTLWRCASTSSS